MTNTSTGTVTHSSGTGTTTISVPVTTSMANLHQQAGTLSLTGGGTLSGSGSLSSGATLAFAGGTYTLTSVTLAGPGTVQFTSGTWQLPTATTTVVSAPFTLAGGIISGAGALSLTGTTTWKNGELLGPGTVTVASGATLNVTSTGYYSQTAAPVVNNGTITVSNGGYSGFTFDAGSSLTNNGTVNLVGDTAGLVANGGGSLTNSSTGTVTHSSGTGTTTISVPVTTSMANLHQQAGTLSLTGGGTLSGSGSLPSGATLAFAGGTYTLTSVTLAGPGTVQFTSGTWQLPTATTTVVSAPFTLAGGIISGAGALSLTGTTTWKNGELLGPGTVTVASGGTLNVTSTGYYSQTAAPVVNNGTITVSNGGYAGFYFDAGSSLTNNGTVSLVGDTAGLVANGGGSLTNSSTGTVTHSSGTGTTTISVPVTNQGTGVIEVDTGTLAIPTLTNVSGSTLTGGTYNLTGILQLTITGGNLVTNAAILSLHGPYSKVTTLVSGVSTNALSLLAANSGRLSLTGGRNITTSATAFANSGTVSIGDGTKGSTLSINGSYTQTAGSTAVAKGSTLTSTASTVMLKGGALTGSGTVSRPLVMSGTGSVQNGSTAGPLNLAGGYSGTGTVKATLSSASIFDQISVTGTANLTTSSLALSTAPGYTPAPGTSFTILSCTVACSGPFASTSGTVPAPGETYVLTYGAMSVTLTVYAVPVVTTQPVNVAVVSGSTASFTATASGYPTPTVQWQYSTNGGTTWANLAGATSTTFSSTVNGFVNGWKLRAVFTNSVGTATSNAALLTVGTPPAITAQPANVTVASGGTATFTAAASGYPTPTVQWQYSTKAAPLGQTWPAQHRPPSAAPSMASSTDGSFGRYLPTLLELPPQMPHF